MTVSWLISLFSRNSEYAYFESKTSKLVLRTGLLKIVYAFEHNVDLISVKALMEEVKIHLFL